MDSSLFDSLPAMVWTAGPDRCCDFFNQSWLDYRGKTLDEERGTGWRERVHPEDVSRHMEAYESNDSPHCSFQVEYRLLRGDSAYRWMHETGVPRFSSTGIFLGHIAACVDVHSRKQSEQRLQDKNDELNRQNDELQKFMYTASHDLQEPLRTIAAHCQVVSAHYDGHLQSDPSASIRFIRGGVESMQTLIHNLLDYTWILNNSDATLVEVDCNAVLKQALFVCQAGMQDSGAVVTHGQLPTVRADPTQLTQVLQNLVGNAIKYRRRDQYPQVDISVIVQQSEWIFKVADNGIGFEPSYAEQIFESFKRLHSRTEYDGTGLGLAICKKIVERHGGRIWATSEPGYGSDFFFTLPRIAQQKPAASQGSVGMQRAG